MHETEVIVVSTPAPVFVDSTGRRSRVLRRLAYGFGALCMLYGGLVSVSLAGGPVSSSAVLPLPDLHRKPDQQVAEERRAPSPAPTVTPSPRPAFATEALPRRPVSATSSLRPGVPRPPVAATRTPSTAPTRKSPTPSPTTTKKQVESGVTKTPTPVGSTSPTGTPASTDPPVDAPPAPAPAPPAGGAGGGSGSTNSGSTGSGSGNSSGTGGATTNSSGTGTGGTGSTTADRVEPPAKAPADGNADPAPDDEAAA